MAYACLVLSVLSFYWKLSDIHTELVKIRKQMEKGS